MAIRYSDRVGRIAISGRIPVSLPGYFTRGEGLLRNAVTNGGTP